jgi:hypothetical protein
MKLPDKSNGLAPFQFTISGLFIATTFIALLCALVGPAGAAIVIAGMSICLTLLFVEWRFGPGVALGLLLGLAMLGIVLVNVITLALQHLS